MNEANKFNDTPLTVAADGNLLIMVIGVELAAYAYEEGEDNNPFNDKVRDFRRTFKVTSPAQFARDTAKALRLLLLDEEEDGSSELTRLLDKACIRAIEDGSEAVEEIKHKSEVEP